MRRPADDLGQDDLGQTKQPQFFWRFAKAVELSVPEIPHEIPTIGRIALCRCYDNGGLSFIGRYAALPEHVRNTLTDIIPSEGGGGLKYYPCRVTLRGGSTLDNVYIVPELRYIRMWGVYPEDDRAKRWIRIEDLVKVEDSPTRLPAQFANEIYEQGESGMGYYIFTVLFSDGTRQACASGSAVDFIRYPDQKGPGDVVGVVPHEGRNAEPVVTPGWYWCLYSETD
jgi:hypothetical protein